MRLFLALRVPPLNIQSEKLQKLKQNLELQKYKARWNNLDLLYIPLAELGDHGRGSFLRIYESIKSVSYDILPFDLKLRGLWGFPKQTEADMLWIDVQNTKELKVLQEYLSNKLAINSDEFLRPYIPLAHLSGKHNVEDLISPFKNYDFGRINIHEVLILEKLSGNLGYHMVGSHMLHGQDVSGLGLS
jgi:2'-5' RNA ligase